MSHGELIRVTKEGSETTISFSPDDFRQISKAQEISDDLCDLIDRHLPGSDPVEQLNIDFRRFDRIDSAGLNGLIGIQSQTRNRGVRLVLTNVQESIRDVFRVTRLERMFELTKPDGRVASLG